MKRGRAYCRGKNERIDDRYYRCAILPIKIIAIITVINNGKWQISKLAGFALSFIHVLLKCIDFELTFRVSCLSFDSHTHTHTCWCACTIIYQRSVQFQNGMINNIYFNLPVWTGSQSIFVIVNFPLYRKITWPNERYIRAILQNWLIISHTK